MSWCLKWDYTEREVAAACSDDDNEIIYQPDNYKLAELVAKACKSTWLIDLGPAKGLKAAALSLPVTGVDFYPHSAVINVVKHDFDSPEPIPLDGMYATVIASDVIEHLRDPTLFMRKVLALGADALVISTPDRLLAYGYDHNGPPSNPCHCREWTHTEFEEFLRGFGLNPIMLNARSVEGDPALHTIVAIVDLTL
jgi:hypothetical protein